MEQKPTELFRLGSVAPDFEADTTKGHIRLYDYVGDSWAILLCYPDDFTPIATTELVLFASLQKQLAERNVKLLVMSTENQPTAGEYIPHEEWVKDVSDIGIIPMEFPIIRDRDGSLSLLYHILDEEDIENLNANDEITTGKAFNTRTIFIIGPEWESKHHIRMTFQYPFTVGFSTGEVLRAIDALQVSDSARVRTPANWAPGGDVIIHPDMGDEEAMRLFPNFKAVKPYLRFVEMPNKNTNIQNLLFRGGSLVSLGMREEDGVMKLEKVTEEHPIESMA